jgi:preprotein translocase SecE subunit
MASTTAQQQSEPVKKAPRPGIQEYLKGVRHELKPPQTHWPSRPEMIKMTQIVLLLIAVVAIYCGGIDFTLAQLTERALPHK